MSTPYVRVCIGPILSSKERVHIEHIAHTEYIYVPWYFPYTVTARLVLHRRPQAAGCRDIYGPKGKSSRRERCTYEIAPYVL